MPGLSDKSDRGVRPGFIFAFSALVVLFVIGVQFRTMLALDSLSAATAQEALDEQDQSARIGQIESGLREIEHRLQVSAPESDQPQADSRLGQIETRLASIEQLLSALSKETRSSAPLVPEFDPSQQSETDSDLDQEKRGWGPEQVNGPPDCPDGNDSRNAWAAREPDLGPEWLSLSFARPAELAEVRIRENHKPGAIVRVTAGADAGEAVLWEGAARTGSAPRILSWRGQQSHHSGNHRSSRYSSRFWLERDRRGRNSGTRR